MHPPYACRGCREHPLVCHRDERTLVRGGARQAGAASRHHRTAASRHPGRAPPDRWNERSPDGGDRRRERAPGSRLALAPAARPRTLAPGTNGPAINVPGDLATQVPATRSPASVPADGCSDPGEVGDVLLEVGDHLLGESTPGLGDAAQDIRRGSQLLLVL